ncbi:dTDP-4-dehydrorhamnose reductase [Zobellella endophytica]|uniref:dTDP-4-dehydrorhamnose reductase n=1 Tax=Zobellella endophytica TaxID=2116700 RepID=A0A2P7RCQ8_9GAMM|nr:dTDP-4-dehydrorhamnose reductase [Zobellella endophytica]PSJ48018.1 dTDP-4-dehydrorhamnose reductase [Zobellella endophytica]
MHIVVTGKNGQLAHELAQSIPAGVTATFLSSQELDISNREAVHTQLAQLQPDAVINAAAYTAVDKAENDREQAFAVNADGPKHLAEACRALGIHLVHVSTDFVFDGSANTPYAPDAETSPVSVYGHSKLAGEQAVTALLPSATIIRTAWVYSRHGNNFVKTMLRLMADKPQLGVVSDQTGAPTWAAGLANVCWLAARKQPAGIYHWSDAGVASWYDFAVAIQALGREQGLLQTAIPVNPIRTIDYPTPARRPAYSVLDSRSLCQTLGVSQVHWREQLRNMLNQL